jgi:hypothetical protein
MASKAMDAGQRLVQGQLKRQRAAAREVIHPEGAKRRAGCLLHTSAMLCCLQPVNPVLWSKDRIYPLKLVTRVVFFI